MNDSEENSKKNYKKTPFYILGGLALLGAGGILFSNYINNRIDTLENHHISIKSELEEIIDKEIKRIRDEISKTYFHLKVNDNVEKFLYVPEEDSLIDDYGNSYDASAQSLRLLSRIKNGENVGPKSDVIGFYQTLIGDNLLYVQMPNDTDSTFIENLIQEYKHKNVKTKNNH